MGNVGVVITTEAIMSQVIKEITQGMGEGMADFIESDVLTVKDYNLYCHYVAGLVGIGLSKVGLRVLTLTPILPSSTTSSTYFTVI